MAGPKDVVVYLDEGGRCPFIAWIENLRDVRARARIKLRIDRVGLGNLGDCRAVGQGVREMRVDYGPGYRIYFGERGESLVVLLCGGDKTTQARDIARAQEYWADWRAR